MHSVLVFILVAELPLEILVSFKLKNFTPSVRPDKDIYAKASQYLSPISRSNRFAYLVVCQSVIPQRRPNTAAASQLEEGPVLVF